MSSSAEFVALATSPLATQPIDLLQIITHALSADDVMRLWMTGDRQLQRSMTGGGVREMFVRPNRAGLPSQPFPVTSRYLASLAELSFKTNGVSIERHAAIGGLELLPKLKKLAVDVYDLWPLFQQHTNEETNEADLASLFPQLIALKLGEHGVEAHSHFDLRLPASLGRLSIASLSIASYRFAYLPNLTHLKINSTVLLSSEHYSLPDSLTHLQFVTAPAFDMLAVINRLPHLTSLSYGFFDDTQSLTPELLNLSRHLVSLTLSQIVVPDGFVDHLPRSLTKLTLRTSGAMVAEDLMNLPTSLTSFSHASSKPSPWIVFRSPTTTLEDYFRALPRGLRSLDTSMPGQRRSILSSTSTAAVLPRSLTSAFGFVWDLTAIIAEDVPPLLRRMSVSPILELGDAELAVLPKSLTHLAHRHLHKLTAASAPTLLSLGNLLHLGVLHAESFGTIVEIPAPAAPSDAPSTATASNNVAHTRHVHLAIESFVPRSTNTLRMQVGKYALYHYDFGTNPFGISSILHILHITFEAKEARTRASAVAAVEFNENTRLPSLSLLHCKGCGLTRESLRTLRHVAPNLHDLQTDSFYSLMDEDLASLPRDLVEVRILGNLSSITVAGLFRLPKKLETIWIPGSPKFSWKQAGMTKAEVLAAIPPALKNIKIVFNPEIEREWQELVLVSGPRGPLPYGTTRLEDPHLPYSTALVTRKQ